MLEAQAQHKQDPPDISLLLEKDENYLFLKLIAVMLVLFGAAALISGGNETLYQVFNGVFTFVLPAITIILAIEKTVSAAVNPIKILNFMLRIGWAYLLMWLCYQIVSSGPALLLPVLAKVIPQFLVVPFFVMIGLYFWFVANCMLGYTVYQYQDVLGYISDDEALEDIDHDTFEKKKALAEAYILLRENNLPSAKNIIRPLLDKYRDEFELHDFYHKLLLLEGEKDVIKRHADYFIEVLQARGNHLHAASIFQDTLAKLPDYKLSSVDQSFKLAGLLEERGRQQDAIRLLTNLHKVEPLSPSVAPAYLLLARLTSEYKNNDAQALKILQFILMKYPNSSVQRDVVAYQKVLKGLSVNS